jgi:hypothetical protein
MNTTFSTELHAADALAVQSVERARALARRQLQVLERLAEAGMEVVLAAEREAKARSPQVQSPRTCAPEAKPPCEAPDGAAALEGAPDPSAPPPEVRAARTLQGLAMAYARAARAVRMTVLAQSRLMRELEGLEREAAHVWPSDAQARRAARDQARAARKAQVRRIVQRVAEAQWDAQGADREAGRALDFDAIERLDEDVYGDVLARPMGEIIARICRDLGLDPDWSRLVEDEAWAEAEMASGAPGSPFAALKAGAVAGLAAPPPDAPLYDSA